MPDLIYKIEFLSDWHCGSGLTAGSDIDLLVIKDKNGLPFVPGRTIKGLLKDAANIIKEFSDEKDKSDWDLFIKNHFGVETKNEEEKNSTQSEEGKCYFSNATLSAKLQNDIIQKKLQETLFRKISSTEIDKYGVAVEHSLRAFETVIPLELYGKISDVDSSKMEKCLQYIKRLGTTRNRGFGRCIISKTEDK